MIKMLVLQNNKLKNQLNLVEFTKLCINDLNFSKKENFMKKFKLNNLLKISRKTKTEELEEFNENDYDLLLGFFGGCHRFNFRVTFKEYLAGLKPAKYSLPLSQMGIKAEYFIDLILEILENNFNLNLFFSLLEETSLNSNEENESEGNLEFDGEDEIENTFNLKLHFLVILKKKKTASKYFILPKSIFIFQIQNLLFYYFLSDLFYLFFFKIYYSNNNKYRNINMGLFFQLIIYYIYKLINLQVSRLINFKKFYLFAERVESRGNLFSIYKTSLFMFAKYKLKLLRYHFFFSKSILNKILSTNFEFSNIDEYFNNLQTNNESYVQLLDESFVFFEIEE